jgi:hypothetical protein
MEEKTRKHCFTVLLRFGTRSFGGSLILEPVSQTHYLMNRKASMEHLRGLRNATIAKSCILNIYSNSMRSFLDTLLLVTCPSLIHLSSIYYLVIWW